MTATATPTQPFLATILDQHYADFHAGWTYDDGPRLVYADYLEEQGDPRAEFIRVQCELERIGREKIGWSFLADGTSTDAESRAVRDENPTRERLQRRESELLKRHGAEWLWEVIAAIEGKPIDGDYMFGVVGGKRFELGGGAEVEFARGFPARFSLTARQAWGEACGRCGLQRALNPNLSKPRDVSGCTLCHGTGRVGAILPAILKACPVESVTVSDREPEGRLQLDYFGWYDHKGRETGTPQSDLPSEVWKLLTDHIHTWTNWKWYPTPADAHAALSRAVIRHGLQGAG